MLLKEFLLLWKVSKTSASFHLLLLMINLSSDSFKTRLIFELIICSKIRYAQPQHRRQTGSVKWFSSQRGYGLTAPSDGSKNVFVHCSSLKSDGRLHLQPNTSIEDEILRGSEGKTEAINATAPGGRLLPNSRKLGPGENITGSSSSSSKSMSSRNSNTSSFNNVGPCFICGQLGHLAKNHLLNQIYFCPFYICFHYPRH